MKIHVFNPEHDLALAFNRANYTVPHSARELHHDLAYLPAFWADEGDIVVVNDVRYARKASRRFQSHFSNISFVSADELNDITRGVDIEVSVWGWDLLIRRQLLSAGIPERFLPTDVEIKTIRDLSSRKTAVQVLGRFSENDGLIGRSVLCHSLDDVLNVIEQWKMTVLKAPWSSSGQGVKFVNTCLTESQLGWCTHVIKRQGFIVAELYNNKVLDFAMEFIASKNGIVSFRGLSLFHTLNGLYTGNIIASEKEKQVILSRYVEPALLMDVQQQLSTMLEPLVKGVYSGPLGVDMMVVATPDDNGFLLNPCVEINFRRTMGHVAMAIKSLSTLPHIMRIVHGKHYYLTFSRMLTKD